MENIKIHFDTDWKEVAKLRDEIKKLEDDLKKIDANKNPQAAKAIVSEIEKSTKKMKDLVAETEYANQKTTALCQSLFNFAQDLPGAFSSTTTFFETLKKHLPEILNQILLLRAANAQLAAQGKTTIPIWRQLGKGLFSWQTLLVTGLSALIAFTPKFVEWLKEMSYAKTPLTDLANMNANVNASFEKGISAFSSQLYVLKDLQNGWNDLGGDIKKQEQFIKDNKKAFDQLGESVTSVKDAEDLLVDNTDNFIEALKLRYKASAAKQIAEDKLKESMLLDSKANEEEKEGPSLMDKFGSSLARTGYVSTGTQVDFEEVSPEAAKRNRIQGIRNKARTAEKEADAYMGLERSLKEEADQKWKPKIKQDGSNVPKDTSDDLLNLKQENAQKEIDLIKDYEERIRKQIEQDYNDRISTLDKKEKEWINAKRNGKLTNDEKDTLSEARDLAKTERDDAISKLDEDKATKKSESVAAKQQEEEKIREEILSKYQAYYDKLISIQEKYGKDRDALLLSGGTSEQEDELNYQEQEEINALDEEIAMREDSFVAWADSIATAGLDKLNEMLTKAKEELEKLKNENPQDKKVAVASATVNRLQKNINKKEAEAEVNSDPKKKSIERWNKLKTTLSGVSKEFGDLGKEMGGTVGDIMSSAADIAGSTFTMIDGITKLVTASTAATEGVAEGASQSIKSVENASVILAIIGAAFQIMNKLKGLFGNGDEEKYEKAKEAYKSYIAVLDKAIERQKELIELTAGSAAAAQTEKAIKLVDKQIDANKTLQKSYLETKKKSGGNRNRKAIGGTIDSYMSELNQHFGVKDSKGGYLLMDFTADQLRKLQEEIPMLWRDLGEEYTSLLQEIIDYDDQIKEIELKGLEAQTGVSFDELKDSLDDLVKDADLTFSEIQKSFEEHMSNAILNFVKKKIMDDKLKDWYEKFADAMASGDKLTKDEADQLQKDYERIVRESNQAYLDAMTAAGLTVESEETSQESTKAGFESMSQDTADELNGRFTALQMAGEEIKTQNILQTEIMAQAGSQLEALLVAEAEHVTIADETREIIVSSYLELQSIRENTGAIVKPINNMSEKLDTIERKIQTL